MCDFCRAEAGTLTAEDRELIVKDLENDTETLRSLISAWGSLMDIHPEDRPLAYVRFQDQIHPRFESNLLTLAQFMKVLSPEFFAKVEQLERLLMVALKTFSEMSENELPTHLRPTAEDKEARAFVYRVFTDASDEKSEQNA